MLVFGTRPEAIKMSPLIKEFQKYPKVFQTIVCVTGQHREMPDQALNIFDIKPNYNLNVMKQGQDLYDITTQVLIGMRKILKQIQPALVLVHGDTRTSTFYQQIPVGHIEAGLRTHNIYSPWPEEINRQITGRIAIFRFAPTLISKQNSLNEHIKEDSIIVTGNTVIDALYIITDKIKSDKKIALNLQNCLYASGYDINRLNNGKKIILITGHRHENFGNGFVNICNAIKYLANKYSDIDFVNPMHLNPNAQKPVLEIFGKENLPNIFFIASLEYLSFVYLMMKATIILTDSGGIQEETPSLGKPVLVMRNTTERPKVLNNGTVKLVGTDYNMIINEVFKLINDQKYYNETIKPINPYGNGKASKKIVEYVSTNKF